MSNLRKVSIISNTPKPHFKHRTIFVLWSIDAEIKTKKPTARATATAPCKSNIREPMKVVRNTNAIMDDVLLLIISLPSNLSYTPRS